MAKTKAKLVYIFLTLTMIYLLYFTNVTKHLEEDKHFELRVLGASDESRKSIEEFKINPKELICQTPSNKPILFIAFVIIAPQHFEKRDIIRSTWGNKSISDDFKILFTIGMSKNETINRQIEEEHNINQDILQIDNFIDNYFNLTTKIMKSFKWITQYCSNAKYILRINDDVILNTFSLIEHFKRLPYTNNQMFGFAIYGASPARNQKHKFYVSEKDYPKTTYDDYVDGINIVYFDFQDILEFGKSKLYKTFTKVTLLH
jgi:hypothetical protein